MEFYTKPGNMKKTGAFIFKQGLPIMGTVVNTQFNLGIIMIIFLILTKITGSTMPKKLGMGIHTRAARQQSKL